MCSLIALVALPGGRLAGTTFAALGQLGYY
jgi:hypothetical protein